MRAVRHISLHAHIFSTTIPSVHCYGTYCQFYAAKIARLSSVLSHTSPLCSLPEDLGLFGPGYDRLSGVNCFWKSLSC
jgi:hypothetical protein